MGTVLLVVHLLVAIFLVTLILMQRSEGGALDGLGGGSGASSLLSARGTGNMLTRLTAILATVFFLTSISLSIYYKGSQANRHPFWNRLRRPDRARRAERSGSRKINDRNLQT